jgi:hypothetical protein
MDTEYKILRDLTNILIPVESKRVDEPWVVLYCNTLAEVEAAIRDHAFIQSHIIRGVRKLLKNRSTTELCLEIKCASTYTSVWISVTAEEVVDSLTIILKRLEDAEEYEECAEIFDLLTQCKILISELNEKT